MLKEIHFAKAYHYQRTSQSKHLICLYRNLPLTVQCTELLLTMNEHIRPYTRNHQLQRSHFEQDAHKMGNQISTVQSTKKIFFPKVTLL